MTPQRILHWRQIFCGGSLVNNKEDEIMKTYNVVLIGCGHMGEVHLKHIYDKEDICISCVCDTNEARAKEFQRRFGAKSISGDAEECISREETDIVVIATYPSTHLALLKLCIKHKKHVICEKPIATTLEEGREFVRLVKENPDVKVLVGHILRHNATYRKVAKMIHDGAIGKPIIMRMVQNHHTLDWPRYRRLIEETSPMIDCGVHYLDVMQWFTDAHITDITGIGMRTETDLPKDKCNYEMVTVKLSDGSIGYYEAGWTRTISSNNTKEFSGPKGNIRLIFAKDRLVHQEEGDLIEYYSLEDNTYHTINVNAERKPTDVQLRCLIRMIEEELPDRPTIDEVYASFEAAIKAEEIIRKQSAVRQ